MALQLLKKLSALAIPQSGDLVETCCQDLGALRIEDNLRYIFIVAYMVVEVPSRVRMHSASATL